MNITEAQYTDPKDTLFKSIKITVDGVEMFVPLDPDNTHYAEILKQVEAGTLTIKDADE